MNARRRVDKITLARPADSILVTADADARLFALAQGGLTSGTLEPGSMQIISADKGRFLGEVKGLYGLPNLLIGL